MNFPQTTASVMNGFDAAFRPQRRSRVAKSLRAQMGPMLRSTTPEESVRAQWLSERPKRIDELYVSRAALYQRVATGRLDLQERLDKVNADIVKLENEEADHIRQMSTQESAEFAASRRELDPVRAFLEELKSHASNLVHPADSSAR